MRTLPWSPWALFHGPLQPLSDERPRGAWRALTWIPHGHQSADTALVPRCCIRTIPALLNTPLRMQSRSTAILGDEELTDQVAPLPAHLLHNATRSESGHEFLGALNRSGAC